MLKAKAVLIAIAMLFGANAAFAASSSDDSSKFTRDYSQVDNYNP